MVLPRSAIKIWGKSVEGFLRYDRTNKQINRDYNFIYIDILELRGRGIGKILARRGIDFILEEKASVVLSCSYLRFETFLIRSQNLCVVILRIKSWSSIYAVLRMDFIPIWYPAVVRECRNKVIEGSSTESPFEKSPHWILRSIVKEYSTQKLRPQIFVLMVRNTNFLHVLVVALGTWKP